jgi:hypothetical protein
MFSFVVLWSQDHSRIFATLQATQALQASALQMVGKNWHLFYLFDGWKM